MSSYEPEKTTDKPKRTRTRLPEIVVDVNSNEDFPALSRRIKSGINDPGNVIIGMKKTKMADCSGWCEVKKRWWNPLGRKSPYLLDKKATSGYYNRGRFWKFGTLTHGQTRRHSGSI